MTSALTGVFVEHDLVYKAPGSGFATDPWGNPVPVTETRTLRAYLRQTNNRALIEQYGASSAESVLLEGRLVSPAVAGDDIRPGLQAEMDWRGQAGRFTLLALLPSLLEPIDEALGQRIVGRWSHV